MTAKKAGKVPILGVHPDGATSIGKILEAADTTTSTKVPHRALSLKPGKYVLAASSIRALLVKHHTNPEALARSKSQVAAMKRLGVSRPKNLSRFPINTATRKGNLAEIVLAEYITAATETSLPVYRVRYNPNVDQSMKGDDRDSCNGAPRAGRVDRGCRARTASSSRDSGPNARPASASLPASASRRHPRVTSSARNRAARSCCSTAGTPPPPRR
jgi:hypothetical protein